MRWRQSSLNDIQPFSKEAILQSDEMELKDEDLWEYQTFCAGMKQIDAHWYKTLGRYETDNVR